jgi:hypothetical protein
VESVGGPSVATSERFQDHQGLSQFHRPFDRVLKAEVPSGPAIGSHPVEYKIALRIRRSLIASAYSKFTDLLHGFHRVSVDDR